MGAVRVGEHQRTSRLELEESELRLELEEVELRLELEEVALRLESKLTAEMAALAVAAAASAAASKWTAEMAALAVAAVVLVVLVNRRRRHWCDADAIGARPSPTPVAQAASTMELSSGGTGSGLRDLRELSLWLSDGRVTCGCGRVTLRDGVGMGTGWR